MKNKILGFSAFFIFISLSLISCETTKNTEVKQVKSNLNPVYITNSRTIQLLPPENMDGIIDCVQLLIGKFGSQEFSFITYFYSDSERLDLSLMSDMGTDLGFIEYDGNNVNFESSVIPGNLSAEYVIADIQNAYYSADALKENYKNSRLIFEEEKTETGKIRKILSGKNVIEQITISENSITIQNYLRGYTYNLTVGEE